MMWSFKKSCIALGSLGSGLLLASIGCGGMPTDGEIGSVAQAIGGGIPPAWVKVPYQIKSAPDLCPSQIGQIDIVAREADNRIVHLVRSPGSTTWGKESFNFYSAFDPTCASYADKKIAIEAIGSDGYLYQLTSDKYTWVKRTTPQKPSAQPDLSAYLGYLYVVYPTNDAHVRMLLSNDTTTDLGALSPLGFRAGAWGSGMFSWKNYSDSKIHYKNAAGYIEYIAGQDLPNWTVATSAPDCAYFPEIGSHYAQGRCVALGPLASATQSRVGSLCETNGGCTSAERTPIATTSNVSIGYYRTSATLPYEVLAARGTDNYVYTLISNY